jgi:hypothetical protein
VRDVTNLQGAVLIALLCDLVKVPVSVQKLSNHHGTGIPGEIILSGPFGG